MNSKLTPPYNESEIFRQIAKGDERAFRLFFDYYKGRFYAVAFKMTRSDNNAQEIVQDIFLKIWQNRTTLTQISNPDSYFFTMLYREVFKHYKKLALERKLLEGIAELPGFKNVTDETVIAQESERLINEAIRKLPAQQQLVFKLSKEEGLSREQVAEKLRISPNTVRNHQADAIKFLRTYLNNASFF